MAEYRNRNRILYPLGVTQEEKIFMKETEGIFALFIR